MKLLSYVSACAMIALPLVGLSSCDASDEPEVDRLSIMNRSNYHLSDIKVIPSIESVKEIIFPDTTILDTVYIALDTIKIAHINVGQDVTINVNWPSVNETNGTKPNAYWYKIEAKGRNSIDGTHFVSTEQIPRTKSQIIHILNSSLTVKR